MIKFCFCFWFDQLFFYLQMVKTLALSHGEPLLIILLYSMKKNNKKGPRYLDLTQYMLTGPFSPKSSPAIRPIEQEVADVKKTQQLTCKQTPPGCFMEFFFDLATIIQSNTPLSKPLYIEIEQGEPSPYLKELLNRVGSSEIEFMDFTLEGEYGDEMDDDSEENGKQQSGEEMSIIAQEEELSNFDQNGSQKINSEHLSELIEEYIPNIHLLDLDPAILTQNYFNSAIKNIREGPEQKQKEFITLYLTDDDFQLHKGASMEKLIEVARHNLERVGVISRLERKAKVSHYLQKRKRRIWRKKINYDCRKKVADNRLRVKGKFVTKEQACSILGIQTCDQDELKAILKGDSQLMF